MVPEINLLPKLERRKSSNLFIILFSVLFAILIIFLSFQFITLKKDVNSLTSEETQITAERDVLVASESTTNEEIAGNHSSSVTFVESVSYPVSPIVNEVHSLLLLNSYLRNYEFGETAVNLVTDFETMNDLSIFVEKLLNSAYFTDVIINEISNFEPVANIEEKTEVDFDVQTRYSATIMLTIDQAYLREGGIRP